MSTITTIQGTDVISTSRAVINTNFSNLNTDKIETSYLDTDTAMAANSDTRIPSQKAVKTYIDTSGGANASETVRGIVEEATQTETDAGTATGATGAKLAVTPAKLAASRYSPIRSVTAGATISGATLPVPVYQNKTDNEFYACDGNDTAAMKFLGFAITNGTNGAAFNVQFSGVVSGFSALDEGEKYYLSDTVGTIQNSPGTNEVLVGIAISATELLIQKGRRYANGTVSATTAITCGFRISRLRVSAVGVLSSNDDPMLSFGTWSVAGGSDCISMGIQETGVEGDVFASTNLYLIRDEANSYDTGSVTSITDTGFTITNSNGGSTSFQVLWEAEGEL